MKKIVSLFLCMVMAMSVCVTAFAAGNITPGTVQTVTLGKGESAEYSFTSSEAAVYQITVKALNKSHSDFQLACEDEIYGGILIGVDYDNENDTSVFNEYFTTGKGYKYNLSFLNTVDMLDKTEQNELGVSDTAKLEFSIKKVTLPEVRLGGTYTVKGEVTDCFMDDVYYCMKPETSGYYNFSSNADNLAAPQLEIISDKCTSKLGGGYDEPFDTTVYMEEGHLYLVDISAIAFGYPDAESASGKTEFTFSINDGSNIKVESITAYEEKITLRKNWYAFGYCIISPSGFTPFDVDKITVTSSNPRVADTCNYYLFQNQFEFEIDSYHYGKTTVTVTLPNGMSTDIKVYVKPRIIIFFENLFASLFKR